jgi:hypothetical protein
MYRIGDAMVVEVSNVNKRTSLRHPEHDLGYTEHVPEYRLQSDDLRRVLSGQCAGYVLQAASCRGVC